ncbi:DUF1900-domain-containing protein [Rozella allomycis CSF55]|uniref:Coronin n=1 Tax=Rozella allomycis (strain CSF55) TaxID=988480 RepID=A0A075AS19_ROZAC|nr:DUF1900 domain-containing protein [Rozella allomycis CSF55]RKP21295.1 DUF1900-domain-containing protein [Rozella allomycis CSF55]|eukprot:EPZ31343.1 DUF1900 domain-containing protein [Rozella allomycis CSF55]
MSRFVRASKFRHVFGTANKREACYDDVRVSRTAIDSNIVKVNTRFMSVNWEIAGGGAFCVWPLEKPGRLPVDVPLYVGHTNTVLDTDFNPFNEYVIASCSEDCTVMVWNIPEGGLTENCSTPALTLSGHGRKVNNVLFHPTAENVLASSSFDLTVKLWDIEKGQQKVELVGHLEFVQSMSWNWTGSLLATTSKDKKLRIFDVRSAKMVQEVEAHPGVKGSRCVWLGDSDRIATTGFSKTSDRQLAIWDYNNLTNPLKLENLDTSSGVIMPFYDNDTNLLFLAGKGDGNIRYFEVVNDDPFIYYVSEYKSSEPQRGLGFLPKRGVNVNEIEVCRAFKVNTNMIEPISFKVPRKSDSFQADLFPDTIGDKAPLTADEFFDGKDAKPILISLEKGFVPSEKKEFVSQTVTKSPSIELEAMKIMSDKEVREAFHQQRKEIEELKNQIAQKDVTIRQLEIQLEAAKNK